MSLGAKGSCTQAYQEVIDDVRNSGVTIVVAAGNDGDKGNPVETPASCDGVITVGAVDYFAERAYYSGFQPYVFIAAAGGDMRVIPTGGILSTFSVSAGNAPLYQFAQGTSMAAPHVSGVAALMLSANPNLTPLDIETILALSATDFGPEGRDPEYGWGLLNAGLAVSMAAGVSQPSIPVPYPEFPLIIFEEGMTDVFVDVFNLGGGTLEISDVSVSVFTPEGGTWLSASLCLLFCDFFVSVDQTGLLPGIYGGFINVLTNVETLVIPVFIQVGFPVEPDIGKITVRLISPDISEKLVVSDVTTTDASKDYSFTFSSVPPGLYLIDAGTDLDSSGFFGDAPDEISGVYPFRGEIKPIEVIAGQATADVNFKITEEQVIISF